MPVPSADVCFLLAYPHTPVAGAAAEAPRQALKDAPYFQPVDLDVTYLEATHILVDGVPVTVQRQIYEQEILLAECRFALQDPLQENGLQLKERVCAGLSQALLPADLRASELYEEYTLLLLAGATLEGDAFVENHAPALARFVRSQRELLNPHDVTRILDSRVRYAQQDLTILDWEGGIVLAPDADFQSEIEVIKIANYQLLRYRMIDERIEAKLRRLRQDLQRPRRRVFLPSTSRRALRQLLEERLTLLLDFERVDQQLLMIGDWYTAQLYRTAFEALYMDDWKQTVQNKLENLQSILQLVEDHFSVSWAFFLDMVQLVGWLLLLLGYILLFFLDLRLY